MVQSIPYDQAYGAQGRPILANQPGPVVATRNPTTADINYKVGREWINTTLSTVFFLGSKSGGSATWIAAGSGATGGVVTLTGDAGGPISPTAGDIVLAGTADQIDTTGAGSTITFSLTTDVVLAGSLTAGTDVVATAGDITATAGAVAAGTTVTAGTGITATTGNIVATAGAVTAGTTVTATLGNITATNGNLVLNTAGNKIVSTSVASTTTAGANSFGTVTLVGGTATVSTTAVTSSSIIFLTRMSVGATGANDLGVLSVGTIVNATSFVINAWTVTDATALQADDVSVVGWMIVN